MKTRIAMALLLVLAGTAAQAQQDANLARNLAATCANCHGTHGATRGADVPALAGVPAERTVAMMAAFKAGGVQATVMHQIAKGYTDEQIGLIAGYFAAQPAKK